MLRFHINSNHFLFCIYYHLSPPMNISIYGRYFNGQASSNILTGFFQYFIRPPRSYFARCSMLDFLPSNRYNRYYRYFTEILIDR